MTHLPLRRLLSTASTASSSLPPLSRGTTLYAPSSTHITSHLSALLSPVGVQLSTEKALRAVTHKSAVGNGTVFGKEREDVAVGGHGERLSFVGRRVLRLHLSLLLSSLPYPTSTPSPSPSLSPSPVLKQTTLDLLLDTKELGAGVGRKWELEKVLRWREVRGKDGEATGLYKSRGVAVEALVGAVFLEFGIAKSATLFEKLVVPHLTFKGVLRDAVLGPSVVAQAVPETKKVELKSGEEEVGRV